MKNTHVPLEEYCAALSLAALLLFGSSAAEGQIYQELYAFGPISTNGNSPQGALVQGSDGNFYGTTAYGGQPTANYPAGGYGTVFRMRPDGTLTTIAWLDGTNTGDYPLGSLVQANDGSFYGGADRAIFRVTPTGTLISLNGGGSYGLMGDLVQGSDGYLYGADGDIGGIYRVWLDGSAGEGWYTSGTPSGGLIQASDGSFYGLTSDGGTYDYGTAFKLTPTGVLTTLASFGSNPPGGNPIYPYGKMLQASDGNLYGVCGNGAGGKVFKLTLSGTLTAFAEFGVSDQGQNPNGGLIQANDGNFYGTTFEGGPIAGAQGTVFKITPQGRISTLVVFSYRGANPGSGPLAGLVQGSDGNLYGACAYGGDYGGGNIFRIIMPGPLLNSAALGQQLVLSWRTNYTGFTLQSSPSLTSATWFDCTNMPAVSGGQFLVTNSMSSGAQFFRLRK